MNAIQRLSRICPSYQYVLAGAAVASAMCLSSRASSAADSDGVDATAGQERCSSSNGPISLGITMCSTNIQSITQPTLLATSSVQTGNINPNTRHVNADGTQQHRTISCDYVIIGNGKAGQSAARTISNLEPSAYVIIVDPNNRVETSIKSGSGRKSGELHYLPARASYIDHSEKMIHVYPTQHSSSEQSTFTNSIHYRKSVLLATGSRGAPPPDECVRFDAWNRILELRSTSLPPSVLSSSVSSSDGTSVPSQKIEQFPLPTKPIPILDPTTVRSLSLMAASQGATVAVMGSGFEALELAASLAHASQLAASKSSTASNTTNNDDSKKVMLLFGNSGPMSARLPRYLSAAISKRLRLFGIEVEERTMTRYLSMDTPFNGASSKEEPPRLEIYTVKSYDSLDSRRMSADLLVVAPSVDGMNGTAVLPSTVSSTTTQSSTTTVATNNHQPWSSLISRPLLTCYLDDGRIATNSEFHAASSIFAAGSVAKYPNARTGQADVAGGTYLSAQLAGEIAATNMVIESREGDKLSKRKKQSEIEPSSHFQESIPVWRSDVIPYTSTNPNNDKSHSSLSLYSMGIHALCIGRCDSEGMSTHGFWWTNTNQQSSESRRNSDNSESTTEESTGRSVGPNSFMRRATRRFAMKSPKGSVSTRGALPVYGSGVVYYLDRCGNIQGVMLWGLPFSEDPSFVQSSVNNGLVKRMKDMIRSNGGVAIRDHSENILKDNAGINVDVDLLSYMHLAEESKHLVSLALTGNVDGDKQQKMRVLGRPLHRYTPFKGAELTNLGKMRRKDDMGNVSESDDLFYSSTTPPSSDSIQRVEEMGRPPSLKRIYPMQGGTIPGTTEHNLEMEREARQLQNERSRPPKEEPLWLRQGEEQRFVNRKEAMADAFLRNMLLGQFSDGTSAVKQAPVPRVVKGAKEQWKAWTGDADGNEEENDSQ